jgi:hypothetical protein
MTSNRFVRCALSAALLAALALPATASAADKSTVRISTSAGVVHLDPLVQAPAWLLRVSGPDGKVAEDTLLDGEAMRIEPKFLGYARWLEGSYQYELIPVLGDRHRGNAARANAPSSKRAPNVISTGSFRVQDGRFAIAGATEPGKAGAAMSGGGVVTPAQTIADDLEVQGSLCVGLDCIANESFGFDTIRMKENNLRIRFDDTSTSAGFPANDWQLTANDSASGGLSKFSIEDLTGNRIPFTTVAGAPTNSVFISSSGNVGFGTSTPVLNLHMNDTDTPAIRFEQNSGGGFTAQTWDVAGNEANFFVRDVTGGSRLPFRIRPGAGTSSLDISATGDVGVGTASPAASVHIARATGNVGVRMTRTSGAAVVLSTWDVFNEGNNGRLHISDDPTGVRIPFKIARDSISNLFRLGVVNSQTVDINGHLKVTGNIQVAGTVGPDYVFEPGFALPTIAEHAEKMMRDKHLPKVGAAQVEDGHGLMDLGKTTHGMLEELEYAHLYIAELDGTVRQLNAQLEQRDAQLQQLREEIDAIKASLAKE